MVRILEMGLLAILIPALLCEDHIIFPDPISTMASVFVTHGGGPYPILQKAAHKLMFDSLSSIQKRFPNPKGIIVFSAHWEESTWTMLDHDNPSLLYDYYGFPPESYNLSYSMSSPASLRNHVKQHLKKNGVELESDTKRGYDHGVFIPMIGMYPDGKVPVIQISILSSLNPEAHFRMGQAVKQLKRQGFLILGSGSSVHGGFFDEKSTKPSQQFENELQNRIMKAESDGELLSICHNWRTLPHAKLFHPREEHFVPLFINMGASDTKKERMKMFIYNLHMSNYLFE